MATGGVEQGGEEQLGKGERLGAKAESRATISLAAGDYSRRLNPVSIKRS